MANVPIAQPAFDKAVSSQAIFRSVMNAMARPGSIQRIAAPAEAPAALMAAAAAIALTLFDHDTPIWVDARLSADRAVADWLRFETGAPLTQDPSGAAFALIAEAGDLPAFERFSLGTSEYPDRSTTLILQVESLTSGQPLELRGPGIDGIATLCAGIAPADLPQRLAVNAHLFPRGVDLILVAGDALAAIARTTRVSAVGG
jgi:alpha-D-ribose 1-methylphosphonate 5-triphosphate synthase subunit PhnH